MTRLKLVCLIVITLSVGLAQALPADRELPISGRADRTTLNAATGENVLSGQVVIRQGSLSIAAAQVTIQRDVASGRIEAMIATGSPVIFRDTPRQNDPEIQIEGSRVVYYPTENRIITEGNARILQAGNQVTGARIEYRTDTGVMVIDSARTVENNQDGEQAEFILQPGVID